MGGGRAARRGAPAARPRREGGLVREGSRAGGLDHDALARDLGLPTSAYDAAFVESAARYAAERELKVAKDDSLALDTALEKGFGAGTCCSSPPARSTAACRS